MLLAAAGGGGSFTPPPIDPIAVARAIVQAGPPGADYYDYTVLDSGGATMDTLHVIDDGAGAYVGVYHIAQTPPFFDVWLATSTDLVTWTRTVKLGTQADIPQIARRADGSFIVGWEDEATPHKILVRRYSNRANLVAGTYSDTVTIAQTLASGGGAEGTPNFYSAEEPMDIGFHYNDGIRDKLGRGTLTGFSGWSSAADSGPDNALVAAGVNARGEVTSLLYLGERLTWIEGQYTVGDFDSFRIWYWDGAAVALETITTHGGSTAQANITVSILEDPADHDDRILFVALYFHSGGAAAGEAGPCVFWKRLAP